MRVADVGGGGGWGGAGASNSMNRSSHQSLSHQSSFSESNNWKLVSKKPLRSLNARWAIPVYPVLRMKYHMGQAKKSVEQNIASKKANRTNIIATNFRAIKRPAN